MLFFVVSIASLPTSMAETPLPSGTGVELTGYARSCRTVWWSPSGDRIWCDEEDLVSWSAASGKLNAVVPIPGYSTHRSFHTADGTLWLQGNVAYDDPTKPDIAHTHPNLDRSALSGAVRSQDTGPVAFEIGAFFPGSRTAAVVVSEAGAYRVRQLDADSTALSTVFYDEVAYGSVPSALAVSADGKSLAVGLAGKRNGVLVYALPDTKPRMLATTGEITDVAFAGPDLFSVEHGGVVSRWVGAASPSKRVAAPAGVRRVVVHPGGAHAVVAGTTGAYWIALDGSAEPVRLTKSAVQDASFAPDGRHVALGLSKRISDPRLPSVLVYELR